MRVSIQQSDRHELVGTLSRLLATSASERRRRLYRKWRRVILTYLCSCGQPISHSLFLTLCEVLYTNLTNSQNAEHLRTSLLIVFQLNRQESEVGSQ